MGSLLKTSVVVGFLLLLPALVYGDRFFQVAWFEDTNCTKVPENPGDLGALIWLDQNQTPNVTIQANLKNVSQTFESVILKNVTGNVLSLVACQAGFGCGATGAIQISFNLADLGACSTAGPPGTQFDKFLLS